MNTIITEWHALKVAACTAFIVIFSFRKWRRYNTCQMHEIERMTKNGLIFKRAIKLK